jgi:RNA polymerase sigma-70 factor (ECF subfamily)
MRAAWTSWVDQRGGVWELFDVSVPDRRGAQRLDVLAREHQAALLAFALKLCSSADDARDLVQDTFERALRAEATGAVHGNERAWLFTVLHHLFIDRCRRRARAPQLTNIEDVNVTAREPEAPPAWTALSVADVRAALDELDPEFQDAYRLHALDGLGYVEIAAKLGVPVNTIGTRIMRARRKLRTILQARAPSEVG